MRTIKSIDEAGHDLRAWCFRCARGERIDAIVWTRFEERGWDMSLPAAAGRFRCTSCGCADEVLVIAATRPPRARPITGIDVIAAYFHNLRSAGKKSRRK